MDEALETWIRAYEDRVVDDAEGAALPANLEEITHPEHSQPSAKCRPRKGRLFQMTYIRPLGRYIPLDANAIEAYHRDVEAQHRWARRWKAFGVWLAFVACCALAWYGILWLAYRATEGR